MIHAVLIFNNAGKPRLTKFYSPSSPQTRAAILSRIFNLVSTRDDTLCNFVELGSTSGLTCSSPSSLDHDHDHDHERTRTEDNENYKNEDEGADDDLRVIYRHYATLYFAFVVDQSESELGILDLIQVLVESLDRCFENVCELDLIFHFDQVHTLLNCIITGGLVLDTSLDSIQQNFRLQHKAKKQSETSSVSSSFSAAFANAGGLASTSSSIMASGGGGGLGDSGGGGGGAWERISSSLGTFTRR